MRIMDIYHNSVVDGEGLRTVIFVSGCKHHCKGCHNKESWNFNAGRDMTIDEIVEECLSDELSDVTISGGDPFYQLDDLLELVTKLKSANKNIWVYTGFMIEELIKIETCKLILESIDVLVDGLFELEKRDTSLYWRGSSNQRVMRLKNGKVTHICDGTSGKWYEAPKKFTNY